MNTFRDLAILALLAFGVAAILTDPTTWPGITVLGPRIAPSIEEGFVFLNSIQPFGSIFCFALSLALFMTRIKF
jgi:hypothetical protein